MDISAGLIAKGTAGALAASAAVGGGIWANENDWFGLLPSGDSSQRAEESTSVPGIDTERKITTEGEEAEGRAQPTVNPDRTQGEVSTISETGTPTGGDNGLPVGDVQTSGLRDTVQGQDHVQVGKASETGQQTTITKWDKTLVDYLRKDGKTDWDIEFDIKTGNNAKTELSNNFPNFEDSTKQLQPDSSEQKSTVTITVSTSTTNLKGADSDTEIEKIKKMNGGDTAAKDWTWECSIVLSKAKEDGDNLPLENKDKLIGDDGYFNRLKKLVSEENDDTNKKNLKELKAKFIENCAKHRKDTKANEYKSKTSLTNNEKISARKTFELQKNNDRTVWEVKTKREFNAWFITTSSQTQRV